MSGDMVPFGDMGDDDEHAAEQFEAQALALKARYDDSDFETTLRKLGVYVEGMQIVPMPTPFGIKPALALGATIGDVAWTPRVLDPETDSMNDQFRVIEKETKADEFLDARKRITEAIERGENPLDIVFGNEPDPGGDEPG